MRVQTRMAKLTLTDGEGKTTVFELFDKVTTVGRSSSCSIQIDDKRSSRNQFQVVRDGEYFLVEDLGSTNGTRLNDKKVTTSILRQGDVIRVGKTTLKYSGPGPKRDTPMSDSQSSDAVVSEAKPTINKQQNKRFEDSDDNVPTFKETIRKKDKPLAAFAEGEDDEEDEKDDPNEWAGTQARTVNRSRRSSSQVADVMWWEPLVTLAVVITGFLTGLYLALRIAPLFLS